MEDLKVTFNFNLLVKKATDEMCAVRLIVRWGKPVKEVKVSTGIKAASFNCTIMELKYMHILQYNGDF